MLRILLNSTALLPGAEYRAWVAERRASAEQFAEWYNFGTPLGQSYWSDLAPWQRHGHWAQ